jgi:hypothetical protein
MIEFGAGGQIVQNEEVPAVASPGAGEAQTETQDENAASAAPTEQPAEGAAPVPAPIPTVVPTTNTRRKRKAKGWFCPVCRQRELISSSVVTYGLFTRSFSFSVHFLP